VSGDETSQLNPDDFACVLRKPISTANSLRLFDDVSNELGKDDARGLGCTEGTSVLFPVSQRMAHRWDSDQRWRL
jgi:hypothetical protein